MIEWTDSNNPYDPVRSRVFEGDRVAGADSQRGQQIFCQKWNACRQSQRGSV